MMFTKTIIAVVLALAATATDACPLTAGSYTGNTHINKAGRVAVGGCDNVNDCQPANCNNVPIEVASNGEDCDVTISECFSAGPGNGSPTSLTFTYTDFVVTNNMFTAQLGEINVEGSFTPTHFNWRIKAGANDLGSVTGNLNNNSRKQLRA